MSLVRWIVGLAALIPAGCLDRREGNVIPDTAHDQDEALDVFELVECGEPMGGWQNGSTYPLGRNIQFGQAEMNKGMYACFDFPPGGANYFNNITIDCDGHTITGACNFGEGGNVEDDLCRTSIGVKIVHGRNITINNCIIRNFGSGIDVENWADIVPSDIILRNNSLENNRGGIFLNGVESVNVENNRACDNHDWNDFVCYPGDHNNPSGTQNIFGTVEACSDGWPAENVNYLGCGN